MAGDGSQPDDVPEGRRDLKKSWFGAGVLAAFAVGAAAAAKVSNGLLRLAFVILSVGAGLMLLWSLMILVLIGRILRVYDRIRNRGSDAPFEE